MSTMGVIQRGLSSILIDLPVQQSARLIEQAVRARTPVSVEPKIEPEGVCLAGSFRGCDGETVSFIFDSEPPHTAMRSVYCDVVFRLRGNEYLFTSVALELTRDGDGHQLELDHPTCLQTWQRRRFLRAAVADSAPIYLSARGTAPTDTVEGRILNVSPEGLACRLPCDKADLHAVGDSVGLIFSIGAMQNPLRFDGTVVSKTPGGTHGMIIVGLRFDDAAAFESERERLVAALQAFV